MQKKRANYSCTNRKKTVCRWRESHYLPRFSLLIQQFLDIFWFSKKIILNFFFKLQFFTLISSNNEIHVFEAESDRQRFVWLQKLQDFRRNFVEKRDSVQLNQEVVNFLFKNRNWFLLIFLYFQANNWPDLSELVVSGHSTEETEASSIFYVQNSSVKNFFFRSWNLRICLKNIFTGWRRSIGRSGCRKCSWNSTCTAIKSRSTIKIFSFASKKCQSFQFFQFFFNEIRT